MRYFYDADFFHTNHSGRVLLADEEYLLDLFAFILINADNRLIYGMHDAAGEGEEWLSYLRANALHYREIELFPEDRYLTLSTCVAATGEARMALVGKLIRVVE